MIDTLQELNRVVNDVVNRIVDVSTQKTMSSNYYASYDMVEDLISREDFDRYFDFIGNELAGRPEVLAFDVTEDKEFDVVYGTAWCPNFEDHDDRFIPEPVSQPLSMTRKAALLDQALEYIQKDISRVGEDRLLDAAELFGTSVEELARLGLPAARDAVLEANELTRKAAELEAQRDYSRPIEFEVFSNNDLMTRQIYGTFEEAFAAYEAVPAGTDKELYCCSYGVGKVITEENILMRTGSDGKSWVNEFLHDLNFESPHVKLAGAKAVLSRDPVNKSAWNAYNAAEAIIGVTGHRLGDLDLQVGNWRVHIIPPGGKYGVNDCVENTSGKHMVEFYDLRHISPVYSPQGQFTGARYYASTLLGEDGWSAHDASHGLSLVGDVPSWTVSGPQMKVVLQFLREETKPIVLSSLADKIFSAETRASASAQEPSKGRDEHRR